MRRGSPFELFAWRALDALREKPEAWGGTPLFIYGFDDFTPLELDALETIAVRCGADVTVSLPFEPGREAFRAVAGIREELLARGAREQALAPVDEHYASESRDALHHLERLLFEEPGTGVDPGSAISLHSAGGERAEVELAGARVLELLRDGVPPGDVAVVFREPGRYASLVEQVFGSYGVPYSIDRAVPFGHTGIGRGLLALIRCASLAGSAEDLLAYLRTPGCSGSRDWPTAWRRRCASRAPTRPSRRVGSGRESAGRWTSSTACARPGTPLPSWPSWRTGW